MYFDKDSELSLSKRHKIVSPPKNKPTFDETEMSLQRRKNTSIYWGNIISHTVISF